MKGKRRGEIRVVDIENKKIRTGIPRPVEHDIRPIGGVYHDQVCGFPSPPINRGREGEENYVHMLMHPYDVAT